MCGILGRIGFKKCFDEADLSVLNRALELQKHRGPDGSGVYFDDKCLFAHTRLSIIDVGHQSDQPMVSMCGNYVLTFNGEIYNYKEIKATLIKKGYQFSTQSDTEVLLNSFIEYGIDCINQFIGMFAFAIFDKNNNETYIVRDRLGVKPLYYVENENELIFSSEIKSILEIDKSYAQINKDAVSSYLSFRYPILNDTFFQGVHSLPPAHYLKVTGSAVHKIEYWSLIDSFGLQKNDKGEAFYIEKLKELLSSAVRYRMISDVPFGAFLSGGVDSSVITAIMAENSNQPIKTFTVGFQEDGYNEFKYANLVASKFQTEHQEIVMSDLDYMATLEQLIAYKDAPLSVPNEVPLYLMCKELKKKITVVLSGEGADEIFGGYGRIFRSPYDYEKMMKLDESTITESEKQAFCKAFVKKYATEAFESELDHFMHIYSYTSFDEKSEFLHPNFDLRSIENKLYEKFFGYFQEIEEETYTNKMMYVFEKIHLAGLLHRVDTTSMANSVETRVPFVDHRLVEFAFSIPLKYKLKWTTDKHSPFDLMSDEISEIYDTPKYVLKKAYEGKIPNEVLYRRKVGFPVPLNNWFGGHFRDFAKKLLLSKTAKSREVYNIPNLEKYLEGSEIEESHSTAMKIWMLINLELFFIQYMN